jgi:hypothetical protein
MTWFTYTKSSSTVTPPVRRKIVFPFLNEFLKVGDWVHVNLNDLDLNRYYYYEDGLIKKLTQAIPSLKVYLLEIQPYQLMRIIFGLSQ